MKKFLIKFCILFAIVDGFLLWYALVIYPNISGDMGTLYKHPFGKTYNDSIKQAYKLEERYVYDIECLEAIPQRCIVTLGDSYSQQDSLGYQQYCGKAIGNYIYNIEVLDARINHPEKSFVRLVNRGLLDSTHIVIIESVERSIIERLNELDFSDTAEVVLQIPKTERIHAKPDYAEEAMQKLRLILGYRRPIVQYDLTKPLFSHPIYSKNIFIYDSPWIGDSELLFTNDNDAINRAYRKLDKLHDFASEHNIRMIYLIVPDKYDVYYPYIVAAPRYNITLDLCPNKDFIVNPRKELRDTLSRGTQDVWYLNDTHWSPVGAKIAGEILANGVLRECRR